MALEPIGVNITAFQGLTDLSFNITKLSSTEIIEEIPRNANVMTNGYYGIIVLVILSIILLWLFTEQSQFAKFRYSSLRGLSLSLGICCVFGSILLQIGYMTSFLHFIYLNSLFMITLVWVILKNPE